MKRYLVPIFFLILVLVNCKSKSSRQSCDNIYNAYISARTNNDDVMALSNLNEAINCNNKNIVYKDEKVNFLIALRRYSLAKEELEKIGFIDKSYSKYHPLLGVLSIKLGNKDEGNIQLKEVYQNLQSLEFDKENFNFFHSNLLLDIYFNGKDHALVSIQNYKSQNKIEKYEEDVLNILIKLIESDKKPIEILFSIFQIK